MHEPWKFPEPDPTTLPGDTQALLTRALTIRTHLRTQMFLIEWEQLTRRIAKRRDETLRALNALHVRTSALCRTANPAPDTMGGAL